LRPVESEPQLAETCKARTALAGSFKREGSLAFFLGQSLPLASLSLIDITGLAAQICDRNCASFRAFIFTPSPHSSRRDRSRPSQPS